VPSDYLKSALQRSVLLHGIAANQIEFACSIDTMRGKDILGKFDSSGNNQHEVHLMKELMKRLAYLSWHSVAANRNLHGIRLNGGG